MEIFLIFIGFAVLGFSASILVILLDAFAFPLRSYTGKDGIDIESNALLMFLSTVVPCVGPFALLYMLFSLSVYWIQPIWILLDQSVYRIQPIWILLDQSVNNPFQRFLCWVDVVKQRKIDQVKANKVNNCD